MEQKKNPDIPEKPDGGLSDDKRYFKAVSNYMANVLGLDRNEVYKMLAEKIEARNVDQVVLEAVNKYFGFGSNGFNQESYVKARLDKTVDEYVKDMFRKGAGAWMDRLIQERLEQMAGLDKTASRNPDIKIMSRPGLHVYQTSVWLDMRILNSIISEWLEANLSDQPHPFTTELRIQSQFWHKEITAHIKNLDQDDLKKLNGLDESSSPPWATDTRITDKAVMKILAGALGWPEISRIVAGVDGVAVFPPETLHHDIQDP